jgi:hypothetical protein
VKAGRGGRVSGTSRSPGVKEIGTYIVTLFLFIEVFLIGAEHQITTQVGLSGQALCMRCGVPVGWMVGPV